MAFGKGVHHSASHSGTRSNLDLEMELGIESVFQKCMRFDICSLTGKLVASKSSQNLDNLDTSAENLVALHMNESMSKSRDLSMWSKSLR